VAIDQAGQDGLRTEVDHFDLGGNCGLSPDRLDAVAFDDDHGVLDHRARADVERAGGFNRDELLSRLLRL
jgi:hypothetical protein